MAPVALFIYNRPYHTRRTLTHLAQNDNAQETTLFLFLDGAKSELDEKLQNEIMGMVEGFNHSFKHLHLIKRPNNLGLANSIISGVSEVLEQSDQIIVLEDDLITSRHFLNYLNTGLSLYKNNQQIYSINGYMFPIGLKENTVFLSQLATSSWGWGTWKDRWVNFQNDLTYKDLIQTNKQIKQRFNIGDLDYASFLENKNSWAIKWYYSVFIRHGLGVFPTKTLVQNIGLDGTGTHCKQEIAQDLLNNEFPDMGHLESINLDYEAKLFEHFSNKPGKKTRAFVSKIKNFIKKNT